MIYKNIEIHNIEEMLPEKDGMHLLRVPEKIVENFELKEQALAVNCYTVGVELRFFLKGETATIRLKRQSGSDKQFTCNAHIWHGALQGHWMDSVTIKQIDNDTIDLEIYAVPPDNNLYNLSKTHGTDWNPELIRIVLDGGDYIITDVIGEVVPPKQEDVPAKTLLTYGSSITFGSSSIDCAYAWNFTVANHLNMDLRNLGFSGCCGLEPEIAEYIAHEGELNRWDVAILELGINFLDWEEEKMIKRSENIIYQIAYRNPDKKVYVISPLYSSNDLYKDGKTEKWREVISKVVANLKLPNVTYINGLEILNSPRYLTLDCVHPDIYGVGKISENIIAKMSI